MAYREIIGDLIKLAKDFQFDVIAHGVNCFCTQKSGLAPQMVEAFRTDNMPLEKEIWKGDINKLGQIDISYLRTGDKELTIVNCYTQFKPATPDNPRPLDYDALALCMRKINHKFKGKKIGLPKIGSRLAGGDWFKIRPVIIKELKDCDVVVVVYEKDVNRLSHEVLPTRS